MATGRIQLPQGEQKSPSHVDERLRDLVKKLGRRLLTMPEFNKIGLSRKVVAARAKRGSLQRIHGSVYLVGAGKLTWQEEILAAVLAGGSTARASSFSAIRLWGLGHFSPGVVYVEIFHGTARRLKGVVVKRTRRATPRRTRDGVPVVCVEEALLAVSHRLSEKVLHRLLTKAWRKRLTTPKRVIQHLDAHGKRVPGNEKLARVAQLYVDHARGPGSDAEADFLFDFYAALDARGIERPELQYVIDVRDGTEKLVPDFTWPKRRKVVEMKGLEAHGDYVKQDEDVEREADIRAAGWDLECVTPRAMRERPKTTIERLIRFLES